MKKIQEARCVSMHTYECAHVCINMHTCTLQYMYTVKFRESHTLFTTHTHMLLYFIPL